MPAISEILDSVKVPALIKDPLIKSGTFAINSRGLQYYSGGFTVVFPVTVGGEKWAYRCWHSDLGNVRKRFKTVSDYINKLQSPYFCDFHYCDEGIVVEGKIYPTTRMRWVDGDTLNQYISANKNNKEGLLSLASEFVNMIDFLHEKEIAHGDLQHGNILVQDGKIKLVDYDSLFVPGLEGSSDIIIGKDDYQHPHRKNLKQASAKLDYFSELVIYISILAIAKQPSLLDKYSLDDSLLFHSSDWGDFKNSKVYADLVDIDDDIKLLLSILEEYLQIEDINSLQPFTEIWRKKLLKPVINTFVCGNNDGVVFKGDETEIVWDVENISAQFIDDIEIPITSRSHKMVFSKDSEIKLILKNGLHTVIESKQIKCVEKPKIKFSTGTNKLRKLKGVVEPASFSWNVINAKSVSLKCGSEVLSTNKTAHNFNVEVKGDSIFKLEVVGLDGKTIFSETISIIVREPANVSFKADKNFTLPGVPVTLSWMTKNVKSARLDGTDVPQTGKSVVLPDKVTSYSLVVQDEFGETTHNVEVQMLPIPVIKEVLVNIPNIERTLGIQYQTPQFESIPNIPSFETKFVTIDTPMVPSLKDSGLFVELPETPKIALSHRISRFFKRIINNPSNEES